MLSHDSTKNEAANPNFDIKEQKRVSESHKIP